MPDMNSFGIETPAVTPNTIIGTPTTGLGNSAVANPLLLSPTEPRPLATSPLRDAAGSDIGVERRDVFGVTRVIGNFARDIGADGYGADAGSSVDLARRLLKG